MNKLYQTTLLAACIGMVLILAAACAPISPPAPAVTPAPSNSIVDIVWRWTSVSNRTTGVTTTVADPENYLIVFRADGTLGGQADCNAFTGTYTQENGLIITLGPMTMAACGETSLDQQYLELLGAIVAGGPDGEGGLALETAGGEQRMSFRGGGAATQ